MDAAVAHSLARQKLESARQEYRQYALETSALKDIVANLSSVFPEVEFNILKSELASRVEISDKKKNNIFAQTQIVSYLAGFLVNQADMDNAQ